MVKIPSQSVQEMVYRIGPFVLHSAFPIPELPLAQAGETPTVWVRYGPVPPYIEHAGTREAVLEVSPSEALLRIAGVAEILVRDGREVVIQAEPGALEADLRAYLVSAAFGVLCHQRGMLPLHASSIRWANGVVAFLGDSGAGKSTLAAFLNRRGYPVVSDDICLLDPGKPSPAKALDTPPARPLVVPVASWMKLWRNTIEHLGHSPENLPRVFSDDDKYRFAMPETPQLEPGKHLPLKQILLLEWSNGPGVSVQIEPLDTLHAIRGMLEFTHQPYLIDGMGRSRECFDLCGRALSGVQAYRFQRPRGFEHIEQVLDALEAHFANTQI